MMWPAAHGARCAGRQLGMDVAEDVVSASEPIGQDGELAAERAAHTSRRCRPDVPGWHRAGWRRSARQAGGTEDAIQPYTGIGVVLAVEYELIDHARLPQNDQRHRSDRKPDTQRIAAAAQPCDTSAPWSRSQPKLDCVSPGIGMMFAQAARAIHWIAW